MRFRLLTFTDLFVRTYVFRLHTVFWLRVAAPVERIRSGRSYVRNFELPTYSQFLIQYRCARFWFFELNEAYIFKSSILETSGYCNNLVFSLFITERISFESLIFFTFYTFFLKNCICMKSIEPIF